MCVCVRGRLTVAGTASVLLPLGGQQLGAMAAWTPSSASLRSSWTGAPTRGSPPSPPKCGREKKASQREILPGRPASSGGGNPQRHRPRAGSLARIPAPQQRAGRPLIGCQPGAGAGRHGTRPCWLPADWLLAGCGAGRGEAARYQAALGPW